jgi:hypothetical protein
VANALSRRPNMGSDDPTVQVNVISVSPVTHNWLIQVTQSYRAYPLAKKILSNLATGDKLEHYTLTQYPGQIYRSSVTTACSKSSPTSSKLGFYIWSASISQMELYPCGCFDGLLIQFWCSLWLERNNRIFQNQYRNVVQVAVAVKDHASC